MESPRLRSSPDRIFISVDESTGKSTVSFFPADVRIAVPARWRSRRTARPPGREVDRGEVSERDDPGAALPRGSPGARTPAQARVARSRIAVPAVRVPRYPRGSPMLLTREEMTFDFGGAKLDPARDRELLEWMFNQFLYGEVTGIQVGHWLYDAPDLEAAKFLARQSLEEMQHVDNFLRIMTMIGCKPKPAHAAVRFLATGMMGGSWAEHVALEMAQGEGFVLQAFYAVIDTLDHKPSRRHPAPRGEAGGAPRRVRRAADDEGDRGQAVAAPPPARAVAGVDVGRAPARRVHREAAAGGPRRAEAPARRSSSTRTAAPSSGCAGSACSTGRSPRSRARKRALLVAEAYGGKLLGGLGSLRHAAAAAPAVGSSASG